MDLGQSKKYARQHEREIAKMIGGRRHYASGAFEEDKGDIDNGIIHVECKFTEDRKIRVQIEWIKKTCKEAFGRGLIPCLALRFRKERFERDWFLVPSKAYYRMGGEFDIATTKVKVIFLKTFEVRHDVVCDEQTMIFDLERLPDLFEKQWILISAERIGVLC